MQQFSTWLLKWATRDLEKIPPPLRHAWAMTMQLGLVLLANFLSFALRFEAQITPENWQWMLRGFPFIASVYAVGFLLFGIQRGLWRYVGFHDLKLIVSANVASVLGAYAVLHGLLKWVGYPRSVLIMTGLLSIMLLCSIRVAVRVLRASARGRVGAKIRVLIVGAGNAGEMLVRDLITNLAHNYLPVVLVDDNPAKQQRTVHGVCVEGGIDSIPALVHRYAVKEIIVAIPSASPQLMQRVLAATGNCRLPIKTLPDTTQILSSSVSIRQARPLRLEDLLQREPIQTDLQELHCLLQGQRVLVTGAGGSIGSELCRQIATYRPARLVLFERYENSLYTLELELREAFPHTDVRAIVGDIIDPPGVTAVIQACAPQLIFHAAAHKHVPLMERNEREAIRNNILGTQVVMRAAQKAGVEQFVLISSDKAVNPTNVMGATKRVAEYMAQEMSRDGHTRFTVVRFGNVLGSNGSVVPLFAEQIRRGGPVTVTHPNIRRYFMTIPEAVQLILQASVRGQGGDVFVLDMGEPVKILDLARNMIVLSGLVPDRDIKMTFTGLRPGEKLFEELFEQGERVEATSHHKIKRVVSRIPFRADELNRRLTELEAALEQGGAASCHHQLQALVPTYCPSRSKQVS